MCVLRDHIPKYLCIGHVCMDVVDEGYSLGGTASYSSLTAHALGFITKIITSYGNDFLYNDILSPIEIIHKSARRTTVFKNEYIDNSRKQIIRAVAEKITYVDAAKHMEKSDIIHLAPIADELDWDIVDHLPDDILIMATPQGWMRKWDNIGTVVYKDLPWQKLNKVDFIIISEGDVPDLKNQLNHILKSVNGLIITKDRQGADLYLNNEHYHFPTQPVSPIDSTGAGDTFATAFICHYHLSKNIEMSMNYAHRMASLCISYLGLEYISEIEPLKIRSNKD